MSPMRPGQPNAWQSFWDQCAVAVIFADITIVAFLMMTAAWLGWLDQDPAILFTATVGFSAISFLPYAFTQLVFRRSLLALPWRHVGAWSFLLATVPVGGLFYLVSLGPGGFTPFSRLADYRPSLLRRAGTHRGARPSFF